MLGFLRRPRQANSAETAKDRLQILLSHERAAGAEKTPEYLPLLHRDIMEVIERHLKVKGEDVDIQIERSADLSMLEINVELPRPRGDT